MDKTVILDCILSSLSINRILLSFQHFIAPQKQKDLNRKVFDLS